MKYKHQNTAENITFFNANKNKIILPFNIIFEVKKNISIFLIQDKFHFGKKVLQVLDHCTIFFFIAGSYTTFILCTFRQYDPSLATKMFIFIWMAAIIGIVLNSIDLKRYKVFSMICYLAMGWCILVKANLLPLLLSKLGLIMLVAGGIAFTIGALLYIIGKKHIYIHAVFHIFIVLGCILQFITIINDVM